MSPSEVAASVLETLRDAAAELVAATSHEDVAAIVRRAGSRLRPGGDASPVFVGLAPAAGSAPNGLVSRGALVVDRGTARRDDLTTALDLLSFHTALALEAVRLRGEITQQAHSRLNALVEQATDVILILDDDDRIRYASPSARVLLGTTELRDVVLTGLVDPAERRQASYLLRHARQGDPTAGVAGRADWTLHGSDGRTIRVEVSCRDLRTEESVRGVVVTLRDVTQQRHLEHELTKRVFRDELTGMPNRLLFDERVREAMAADIGVTGVLLVDLDDFRAINEALGRETGDAVMRAVAARISGTAGEDRLTARMSGDEFAVLVANVKAVETVDELAGRLVKALTRPISGHGGTVSCTGTVGVATTAHAGTGEELMRHADLAVDAAKAAGKATWRRYDPATTTAVGHRLELRSALGKGLRDGSLIVEYQPIVELDAGRTAGFEALVRWRHPTRGVLSPGEFIDIAEESGLITPIGEWVLTAAVHDAQQWHAERPGRAPYVSVNVSVEQFRSGGFVDTVRRLLDEARLPPARLVLEITEGLLLRDDDKVWEDLKRLRQWGVRVAIDDFGTGYSALGHLRQVPLDIVKLDRIFIGSMATSARQRELVRGIVRLTKTLGLTVVAEGIETEHQRDVAASVGCAYGQGFLFARSMSQHDAIAWTVRAR